MGWTGGKFRRCVIRFIVISVVPIIDGFSPCGAGAGSGVKCCGNCGRVCQICHSFLGGCGDGGWCGGLLKVS